MLPGMSGKDNKATQTPPISVETQTEVVPSTSLEDSTMDYLERMCIVVFDGKYLSNHLSLFQFLVNTLSYMNKCICDNPALKPIQIKREHTLSKHLESRCV